MSEPYFELAARPLPSLLSIVVPFYNEEAVAPLTIGSLNEFGSKLPCPFEIVAVNDGSSDGTVKHLLAWARSDSRVKVISLARNFGHQLAATAGLDYAAGDAIVLMDADLQDPPELILRMLERYCDGYDVVYAQRTSRDGETWLKKSTAWLFYRLMQLLVYRDLPRDAGDFRLVSRQCLDVLVAMRETSRFIRGLVAWVGFPQTAVPFKRPARAAGRTKYSVAKMLKLAWTASLAFSPTPLRVTFFLGVLVAAIGLLIAVFAVLAVTLHLYVVPGWASIIVVNCVLSGTTLVAIGIVGEYIAKIFEEAKRRPLYVIKQTVNFGGEHPTLDLTGELDRSRRKVP